MAQGWPWYGAPRRELYIPPSIFPPDWTSVVACLNVWNDRAALEKTLPRWLPLVDQVIAIDGAYEGVDTPCAHSTDGTLEFLHQFPQIGIISTQPDAFWPNQVAKRNRYFAMAPPGAMLVVIDADEILYSDHPLRDMAAGADCGWVTVQSPTYKRLYSQPRVFRARPGLHYAGRHHWVKVDDDILATHQYGGTGFIHRQMPGVVLDHLRHLGRTSERRSATKGHRAAQLQSEGALVALESSERSDTQSAHRESLRILQLSTYDPGLVAFRLHTALNTSTRHASILGHREADNPFEGPHQYGTRRDTLKLRQAAAAADVIHCHLSLQPWTDLKMVRRPAPALVIHHHGTLFRNDAPAHHVRDRRAGVVLRLVSNPELLKYDDGNQDLQWLPNPVPVGWYGALAAYEAGVAGLPTPREDPERRPFRVAHSPSKRHRKGTEYFLDAVNNLRARGVPIEADIIEASSHAETVRRKARAHATFDSFWLGMQCSGLEAAAMGQAVIAGDPDVAGYLATGWGECPYTFANTQTELELALERLAMDPEFYLEEAARVSNFVERVHDTAAVALEYEDLLDEAIGWRAAERGL